MMKRRSDLERRLETVENRIDTLWSRRGPDLHIETKRSNTMGNPFLVDLQKVRDELCRQIDDLNKEKAQLEFDKNLAKADDKVEFLASIIREKLVHL